jgi:hypothetical protein
LAPQSDKAIGLNRNGLIELRGEGKSDFQYVTFAEPVERTAFSRQSWTRRAVRYSGISSVRGSRDSRDGGPGLLGDGYH